MTTPNIRELRRQRARRHARWPLSIRLLIVAAALYLVYVLLGFFVAPSILKSKLQLKLTEQLKRETTIENVAFNPLTLSIRIDRLKVKDHDGQLLCGWNRLFVNFQLLAVLSDELHFSEIDLDGFAGRVFVSKEGILNIADLTHGQSAPDSASRKNWVLRIDRLTVSRAELDYADESRAEPFHTHVGPTTFVLREFRTSGSEGAPGVFTAATESEERIEWTGRLALAPLRSTGEVRLNQLRLNKYAPFYAPLVGFDILNGTVDVSVPYEFSIVNNKPQVTVSEAKVTAHDVQLAEHGKTDALMSLHLAQVGPVAADLQAGTAEITRVALEDGAAQLVRETSGINLLRLMPASRAAQSTPAPVPGTVSSGWKVAVNEISGKDFSLKVSDRTTPRPGEISLAHANFTVRHFASQALGVAIPVEFQAELIPAGGTVSAHGSLALSPMEGELQLAAEGLAIAPLSPWIENFADLQLTQGLVNAHGMARLVARPDGTTNMSATGDADINLLQGNDNKGGNVIRWKSLGIHGVMFSSNPARFTVAEISLADPEINLVRRSDQTLNVLTLIKPSSPTTRPANAGPAPEMFVAVDRITIAGGSGNFTDESIDPPVKSSITELAGAITGVTSADIDRADLRLTALVNGAPLTLTGKVNFLSHDLAADLKLDLQTTNLVPLSPYVAKFVGYQLNTGSASIDARAKVSQQKLDSSTNILVTNFLLGDATNSPDAPHVPVHLALALLRDAQGRIALNNLSVSGDLGDPRFQIGNVVMHVITNLIVKAATSPFTLIGSMFGGGGGAKAGEELSFIEFDPGSAEIPGNGQQKLDVLAKALHERPALHLAIFSAGDSTRDGGALREQALDRQIHAELTSPTREIAGPINPSMQIGGPLNADAQAIAALYQKQFLQPAPTPTPLPTPIPTADAGHRRFFLFRWFGGGKETPAPSPKKPQPSAPAIARPAAPVVLPSVAVMREHLLERIVVSDDQIAALAAERAKEVRLYLVAHGPVDPDRVTISTKPPMQSTQVRLQLE